MEAENVFTVSVAQARANLAKVLSLVQNGATVYVTKRNKIVAQFKSVEYANSEGEKNAVHA